MKEYWKDTTTTQFEGEIWKDTVTIDGLQASNLGRIRSLDRVRIRCNGKPYFNKGRILTQQNNGGYKRVSYNYQYFPVHRLVMLAFEGECPSGKEVDHKNGNRSDNRLENLHYCTHSENMRNPNTLNNYISGHIGKRNTNAIYCYTNSGVFVRKWNSIWDALRELRKPYDMIHQNAIGSIKSAYGFQWRYYYTYKLN